MKNVSFDSVYERIMAIAKVEQDVDLAYFLGISAQAVGAAKKKRVIPRTWWRTIEEKSGKTRDELTRPPKRVESPCMIDLPCAQDQEEKTPIHKLLVMTSEVLESDTVYRGALASNIRAFHKAVQGEKEMSDLREKMDLMLRKMDEMEQQISELMMPGNDEKKRAGNDN